ncbi:hypothetical protein EBT31_15990, partial [bacterium]|nr:hypothetical protein [bacterium]
MSYVVRSRDVWVPDSDYEDGGYWDVEYYEEFVQAPDDTIDPNVGLPSTSSTTSTDTTGVNTGRVAINTPITGTPTQIATAKDMLNKVMSGSVTSQDFLKFMQDNPTGMAGILGGLLNMGNQQQYNRVGYQGTIPQMTATRSAVPFQYDPTRRPGGGGRQYFTDVQYTAPTAAAANAAQEAARAQARAIAEQQATQPKNMAHGGLAALAKGRYLQGATDGMADKLPAKIDGKQPAALSHGEFVVPADVVSHLGNGNSDAGAKKLYSMMDKIRMARTGTKKQGKKINPDKYMPGGSVGYASGGEIKGYAAGDLIDTTTTKPAQNVYESNLSGWAGPYVTGMLGKGQALSEMPYQAYQGPLTSGASGLQQQAFQTASNLQTPAAIGQATQTAGDITGQMRGLAGATFGTQQAQQYMNPYLQTSLIPQLAEARRQADITNMQNMAKLTQAGAYGGGRQAVLQAESDRNMAANMANITGQGFNTAYQQALGQYNADQARSLAALQGALGGAQAQGALGAQQNQVGLANLAQQAALGQQERGITSEGIAADKAQFEEARDYPYKMVQ